MKIAKDTGIENDPQRIINQDLCKISKHFLQFPSKKDYNCINCPAHDKTIYYKNLSNLFLMYLNIHFGNTLLVDDTPYKCCLNPPFNAIFVESYEDLPKEDNYLMKILLLYLKLNLHYFGFNVPTFVKLYPFGTIKNFKEDDVRSQMLLKKCTMAYYASFSRNRSTSIVNSPNFFFCSFLPFLSWIFQILSFMWSLISRTLPTTLCFFYRLLVCHF